MSITKKGKILLEEMCYETFRILNDEENSSFVATCGRKLLYAFFKSFIHISLFIVHRSLAAFINSDIQT